ncbi:MAG TPA: hypothetical protein VNL35_02860, partial [Chloroflexota bacterium]|nr:hypothetical protein [Chloroflexota bacterium]
GHLRDRADVPELIDQAEHRSGQFFVGLPVGRAHQRGELLGEETGGKPRQQLGHGVVQNAIAVLPIFPYYGFDFHVLYGAVDGQKFGVAGLDLG